MQSERVAEMAELHHVRGSNGARSEHSSYGAACFRVEALEQRLSARWHVLAELVCGKGREWLVLIEDGQDARDVGAVVEQHLED